MIESFPRANDVSSEYIDTREIADNLSEKLGGSGEVDFSPAERFGNARHALSEIDATTSNQLELDSAVADFIDSAVVDGNVDDEGRQFAAAVGVVEILEHPDESPNTVREVEELSLDDLGEVLKDLESVKGSAAVESVIKSLEAVGNSSENFSSVESSANFMGNWTEAQASRTSSPDFLKKLDVFIQHGAEGMKDTFGPLDREKITKDEYKGRLAEYAGRHDHVTSYVGYVPSSESQQHAPSSLGYAEYENKKVVVFSDAESSRQQLTNRQKDIIAAHEVYHALINPKGDNVSQIRSGFNFNEITIANTEAKAINLEKRTPGKYLRNPDELTARMAQVKNYFGMSGAESFTQEHLDYAREHYVGDTGLDNNMTMFFRMIEDDRFVKLMNELPV